MTSSDSDAPPIRSLLDLDHDDLRALVADAGEPAFRADQLRHWLHARRVDTLGDMRNLPKRLRGNLAEAGWRVRILDERDHRVAEDGLTEKWLFAAPAIGEGSADGEGDGACAGARLETVLIREKRLTRHTVCVSSMGGCPLGCRFCATGQAGYVRDLRRGEMLEQVYRVDAACRDAESSEPQPDRCVDHVVFMGMGEPLLNLDAVLSAAAALADPEGLHLSGRHITLSTVGVVEGIERLTAAGTNLRLAVSLHAPDQALRETLLPAARRWPLDRLMPALRAFARQASRAVTFEYCLVDGVNDADAHARALARLLDGFDAKVNLIPLNPTDAFEGRPSTPGRIRSFQTVLEKAGVPVTLRQEKGGDIRAACGQLGASSSAKNAETP